MRQKRGKKKPKDKVFTFKPANGETVTIGDGGAHRELTPARLKESAANQAEWAAKSQSPFVQESPQMAALIRARRQVPEWQQSVDAVEAELAKRSISTEERAHLKERLVYFKTVLAETMAEAGYFEQAAATMPDVARRAEYRKIVKALEKPDDQPCKCKQDTANIVTKESVVRQVWSERHRRMMPLIRCNHCDDWNVKPETQDMADQRDLRRKAEQLTMNARTPDEARQALERANHPKL